MVSCLPQITKICCALIALYAGTVGYLYVNQTTYLYHPQKRIAIDLPSEMKSLKEIRFSLPSGKQVYGLYQKAQKGKQTILFFHGNTGFAEQQLFHLTHLVQSGFGVFAPEYVGFGDIHGTPTQSDIEQIALTAVKYLNSQGIKNNQIIVFGHSLGTYPALFAAAKQPEKAPLNGVVLESPFLSLAHTAADTLYHLIPVSLIIKDRYPNDELIDQIHTRIFIGHSEDDPTIGYYQGSRLFEKAKQPKTFFSAKTFGHNHLSDAGFQESIQEWLQESVKPSTSSPRSK